MDSDYKGPLARAQAEAAIRKFLESGSEDESEWLRAAVDYLKKITVALVSEFLPSNSANPDLDIQRFRGAIESTIDKLWETPYRLQPILQGFNYGLDGSKFAFQIAVRPIELEWLWQNEVTDFWSRHAAYLEKRSWNGEPFPEIAETVSLPEPKLGEFCEKDAGPSVAGDGGNEGRNLIEPSPDVSAAKFRDLAEESAISGAGEPDPVVGAPGRPRRGRPRRTRNLHPEVEPFLDRVSQRAERRVTITEFCLISGFGDDTVFGFWRQGNTERCSNVHAKRFERTLRLSPEEFLTKLTQLDPNKR